VINEYKQKINEHCVFPMDYYGSSNFVSDSGTAHVSLVGPNGDAVAATSSINLV
jgi:gamma-glutamyltranspeptidase